jgi:WhiB family redox-sensing transcriptional regulator
MEESRLDEVGPACCAGLGHWFFSDDPSDLERAKEVCRGCSRRRRCLAGALARHEAWGVWGGEIIRDGAVVPVAPRRGRPRTVTAAAS